MLDSLLLKIQYLKDQMSDGKSISVWYSEDERRRLEEAAAIAGYKHLSRYIRDRSLDREGRRATGRDAVDAWAEQQELLGRLAEIENHQRASHALLGMLFFLMRKKATTGEVNELILACEKAGVPADLLPDLAVSLSRFTED